jgi:death-on-curing protein
MRYLTLGEVLALHRRILAESGGRSGLRDLGAIASALSQPKVMELRAGVDDQERFMLALAAGDVSREALAEWLRAHATELRSGN